MAKKLEEVESELPKITGKDFKSPVKFELEIQRQRILYILHCAVKKMTVMACLPMMLEDDARILEKFLSPSELEFVKFACSKYLSNGNLTFTRDSTNIMNYIKKLDRIALKSFHQDEDAAKYFLGTLSDDSKLIDYHISEVVQIITSNEELKRFIKEKPCEMDENVNNLISCMKHLKELILEKLMITSREQMEMDKQLRLAYKSNFLITQNINILKEQIQKQQNELGTELDKKKEILQSYRGKLEELQEEFNVEMQKKIQKSEKKMMSDSLNSEARQSELEKLSQQVTSQYANLLESDLNEESQLRQKRNKVEAQLAGWIGKYDNDVGEKQVELEKLEKQYGQVKTEFDALTEEFIDQSIRYYVLMEEKEAEERRVYEEMAFQFLQSRSARRIQRYWRAYWRRKLERRRAKKAAKGKKDKTEGKKKKKSDDTKMDRKADVNKALEKAFKKKDHVFEELDTTKEFVTQPVQVDLTS